MNDIFSDYCDLPTGVWKLEFLPGHEIAGWDEGVPVPALRWYGIGVYRNSLTYEQPTETSPQGPVTQVSVGCLVVNDSAAVATQLDQMEQMRFALRVTHYDARKRIVGAPEQLCELIKTEYTPTEIVGAQGYQLNFGGQFSRRPLVVV